MLGATLLYIVAALSLPRPALDDVTVARLARDLLQQTGADDNYEIAAFAIRDAAGGIVLRYWENHRQFRGAQWSGPLPDGVLAVLHTHPYRSPLPSMRDAAEARRLQLPFYVVSRAALCVVDPAGLVRSAGFIPWMRPRHKDIVVSLQWRQAADLG